MSFKVMKKVLGALLSLFLLITLIPMNPTVYDAFPSIGVDFDSNEQSVIVSGIPANDANGCPFELRGSLYYGNERIETFCYAPNAMPYHVANKQAYIFNWTDAEFLLPCSGEYQFTAYLSKIVNGTRQDGPKTTITIYLTKKDESTNWGPGLPNTTVEAYDLKQMQGKDKNIVIEEPGYTWTINGMDIQTAPEENLSLAITPDSENFSMSGVEEFFGDTLAHKFSIEHNGEFGFKATLTYSVGAEYASKYANLFYVVGDGTFEFIEGGLVDENGNISYTFTHASDYVIAITDVEYTGQELDPKTEETEKEVANTESLNTEDTTTVGAISEPEQPSISPFLFMGLAIIVIAVAVTLYIKKK